MVPYYDNKRNVIICFVDKAIKGNAVCKKGESYIWVQRTKYAPKEYFKTEDEVEKVYPKKFIFTVNLINKIILEFERLKLENPKLKPKDFLLTFLK